MTITKAKFDSVGTLNSQWFEERSDYAKYPSSITSFCFVHQTGEHMELFQFDKDNKLVETTALKFINQGEDLGTLVLDKNYATGALRNVYGEDYEASVSNGKPGPFNDSCLLLSLFKERSAFMGKQYLDSMKKDEPGHQRAPGVTLVEHQPSRAAKTTSSIKLPGDSYLCVPSVLVKDSFLSLTEDNDQDIYAINGISFIVDIVDDNKLVRREAKYLSTYSSRPPNQPIIWDKEITIASEPTAGAIERLSKFMRLFGEAAAGKPSSQGIKPED